MIKKRGQKFSKCFVCFTEISRTGINPPQSFHHVNLEKQVSCNFCGYEKGPVRTHLMQRCGLCDSDNENYKWLRLFLKASYGDPDSQKEIDKVKKAIASSKNRARRDQQKPRKKVDPIISKVRKETKARMKKQGGAQKSRKSKKKRFVLLE